jgi:integrase
MPNKQGHRRFGNVRRLPSGRYQVRYPGPDGRLRSHPQTFDRKGDAERTLSLIEAQIVAGEWTDPQRGKTRLADYARDWITQRPGLRIRTVDFYRWLLAKHIEPYLGDVPIGKLTTQTIREWRSGLLARSVSATMTAKAYRLLRAVLMTAVEEDKILPRNPCRIRGAGSETASERPVLTVAPVFELAELVGRRPIGNVRQLAGGGYRLRYQRHGQMHTAPEVYLTRPDAERALWAMTLDGRADCNHDRRFRALVLLATFASLRWGEVIALRRCDIDLDAGTVRVRAAYAERSTGEIILGPPKSKASRRIVGIPRVIVPDLRHHLAAFADLGPGALAFPGAKGGPLRRGNFNRSAAWPQAVATIGAPGLHFHDLRHTGNTFAAASGAGLRDLMARMGHDSERAAIIYQHEARGADAAITNAIDAHVDAQRARNDGDDLTPPGTLSPAG